MEYNQDLTVAHVTVKVNGGVNVLRNIFHFNSEAIEDNQGTNNTQNNPRLLRNVWSIYRSNTTFHQTNRYNH